MAINSNRGSTGVLDQVKFGEKLRNYRKSLGMTQE